MIYGLSLHLSQYLSIEPSDFLHSDAIERAGDGTWYLKDRIYKDEDDVYAKRLADEMRADIAGCDESDSAHKNLQEAAMEVILNLKHDQLIDRCNGKDNETLKVVSHTKRRSPLSGSHSIHLRSSRQ